MQGKVGFGLARLCRVRLGEAGKGKARVRPGQARLGMAEQG